MIVVIDGIGANINSVKFAIERLGKKMILSHDPQIIKSADYVILPGVGSASYGMRRLRLLQLDTIIPELKQPVLGICLGMQLLFSNSEEGNVRCLSIIPNAINRIVQDEKLIIPHMGWNQINFVDTDHLLFNGIKNKSYQYFVHSYVAPRGNYTLATTDYGTVFSSIVQSKNFYGVQFHPERSGKVGECLLKNFLSL